MKIVVAGDFVPRLRVQDAFEKGDYSLTLQEVQSVLKEADYSIVNLEAPIVVSPECTPIEKIGPHLKTDLKVLDSLSYAGFDCVSLANNHIRDYGDWGISDTLFHLSRNGFDYVGAGLDDKEASNTLIKLIDGQRVSIINCCEHEFSIAGKARAGANPLDPIKQYATVQAAKRMSDWIIMIVHGGIEGYQLPAPRMKDLYHYFIDIGVNVIINHHQHCYSGFESYNDGYIFYGLGNFCFDKKIDNNIWNQGYLLQLTLNNAISFSLIPYYQCGLKPTVSLLSGDQLDSFNEHLIELNQIISDDEALLEKYIQFLTSTDVSQKYALSPYRSKLLSYGFIKGFIPGFIPTNRLLTILSKVQCESHRDRLIYHLRSRLGLL